MEYSLIEVAKELKVGIFEIIETLLFIDDNIDPNSIAKLSQNQYEKIINFYIRNKEANISNNIKPPEDDFIIPIGTETQNSNNKSPQKKERGRRSPLNQHEIWSLYIKAQEQILNYRALPISINPKSVILSGDKLSLEINKDIYREVFLDELIRVYNLSPAQINLEKGYFTQTADFTSNISNEEKIKLVEFASANYINFNPNPIFEGTIFYKKSQLNLLFEILKANDIQFSVNDKGYLYANLESIIAIKSLVQINNLKLLPEKTCRAFIKIYPSLVYILKKQIQDINVNFHYYRKEHQLRCTDFFIPNDILVNFETKIKLRIDRVVFNFNIDKLISQKLKSDTISLDFENYKIKLFDDKIIFSKNKDFQIDILYELERLLKYLTSFSPELVINYSYTVQYEFSKKLYLDWIKNQYSIFDEEFTEYLKGIATNETFNINILNKVVSLSFDYETLNFDDKFLEPKKNHFLEFEHFGDEHKYILSFFENNNSLLTISDLLRSTFPSIQTKLVNNVNLDFWAHYQEYGMQNVLYASIKPILETLNVAEFEYKLFNVVEGIEKYLLEEDNDLKEEDETSKIKALRGEQFFINSKTQELGSLLKVNYPKLIFQIENENITNVAQFLENSNINYIQPNLKGELDKIVRLKETIELLTDETRKIANPNLRKFIFNSEIAPKTTEIEFYTNPLSTTFAELKEHQLNKNINQSQLIAVIKTLLSKDLALVQGPPGTGKSTAIAEIIWHHIRKNPQERLLLTSETNLAVDIAIYRVINKTHNLIKPIRFGTDEKLDPEGKYFSIQTIQNWVNGVSISNDTNDDDNYTEPQSNIIENWIENIQNRSFKFDENIEYPESLIKKWSCYLSNPTKELKQLFTDKYIKYCNVIGATCSSIGKVNSEGKPTGFYRSYSQLFGNRPIEFTTVIQDEASKATPAELALPLVYGKKSIVVGDHRQLPPLLDKEEILLTLEFLKNRAKEEIEKSNLGSLIQKIKRNFKELETSHFERLFTSIDNSLKATFNQQYRMHPHINEVIKQFYINDEGGLNCGLNLTKVDLPNFSEPESRYHGIEIEGLISPDNHVIWIDIDTPEILEGTSRVNHGEIEAIHWFINELNNSETFHNYNKQLENLKNYKPEDIEIGLISFYGKQLKYLKSFRSDFSQIPMRISTVDRFQGMERNIIIVSMVRSNTIATHKDQKPDIKIYGELGYPEQKSLGFAELPNRLNVALSRARRLLVIVGNSTHFSKLPIYENVYKVVSEKGLVIKYPLNIV